MKLACHRLKPPKPRAQINPLSCISCRVVTLVHKADCAMHQVPSCSRGSPVFSSVTGHLSGRGQISLNLAAWSSSFFSPWKTPIHPSKFSSYTLLRSVQNSETQVRKEGEWGMNQRERKSRGGMTRNRGCPGQPGGLGHSPPGPASLNGSCLERERSLEAKANTAPLHHQGMNQQAGTRPRISLLKLGLNQGAVCFLKQTWGCPAVPHPQTSRTTGTEGKVGPGGRGHLYCHQGRLETGRETECGQTGL